MTSTTPSSIQWPPLGTPSTPGTQIVLPPAQNSPLDVPQGQALPPLHQKPAVPSKIVTQYQPPNHQCLPTSAPQFTPPSQAEVEKKPWKYLGYPGFAVWSASSKDALVLRRFNGAHARVLYYMQDQIVRREEELARIDQHCVARQDNIDNGTFRYDQETRRSEILDDLRVRLKEYNEFILTHRKLRSDPRASDHEVKNVKNWFFNNNYPIHPDEGRFINTDDDLVALVPKIRTPLRRFLDMFDCFRLLSLFRIRPRQWHHYPAWYESRSTKYHSDSRTDSVVTFLIMSVGLGMLIGPLWLLRHFVDECTRLQIISSCLVIFSGLLSIVTVARPFETLAATAAYAAVLMVFMQLTPGVKGA